MSPETTAHLAGVPLGHTATVLSLHCERTTRRRLMEMGLLPGTPVTVARVAPMGCPLELRVRDSSISIRRADAALVHVEPNKQTELTASGSEAAS